MKQRILWLALGCVCAGVLTGCPAPMQMQGEDEFTIRLMTVDTADHVQRAQMYKESTERETGWKGLYVLVKGDFSELYWGKYPSTDDAAGDVKRAKKFKTSRGIRAFPEAIVIAIPGKDIGPPEWNLANAKGIYTVVIASIGEPDRKVIGRRELAVEVCKYFREQEREEAYFYHTNVQSIVTIGTFDASAIKEVKDPTGTITSTYINSDKIRAILARHPYMEVNGRRKQVLVADLQTKKPVWIDKHSYVIRIPTNAEGLLPEFPTSNPTTTMPATQR